MAWVLFIVQLLPTIMKLVQEVQEHLADVPGQEKKAAVMAKVQALVTTADLPPAQKQAAMALADTAVDSAVTVKKDEGWLAGATKD